MPSCIRRPESLTPHYLLFSEAGGGAEPDRWRLVLRLRDGTQHLVADDIEPGVHRDRLELLAIVRGLESLDRPSRVTIMTSSSYVCEGIRRGLREWRNNGWQWEFFGQMVPVKNRDLWERIEHALQYHQVDCLTWRCDEPHGRGEAHCHSLPRRAATAQPRRDSLWERFRRSVGRAWANLSRIVRLWPPCLLADGVS